MRVTEFDVVAADGTTCSLSDFAGQALLIVNTASRCGFTPQFAGLEMLQRRYGDRGFSVLAFPCNQFGAQEPGDAAEIASFCATHYEVSFPVFAKLEVNGPAASLLFGHLKAAAPGLLGSRRIKWNFTKFLVNREGVVISRHAPTARPEDLAAAIEGLL